MPLQPSEKLHPAVTMREQPALDDPPSCSLAKSAMLSGQRRAAFPRRGTPEQAPPWRLTAPSNDISPFIAYIGMTIGSPIFTGHQ